MPTGKTSEESPLANPARLAELVAYQEGAVVSRTVLNRPAGTVTLFAFTAGQSLSEHTAPFDALVCLFEGEAEILIGGRPHRLQTGDIILLPASIPHAVKAVTRFKMLLIMIRS